MKKNIGILFPLSLSGGVFQYATSIAGCLVNYCNKFNYTILHYKGEKANLFFNEKKDQLNYLDIPQALPSSLGKVFHFFNLAFGGKSFLAKNLEKALKGTKIDLLIIPTPFSFDVPLKVPFVASVPDYMHRYFPNFSEYTFKDKLTRDIVYKYYAKNALLVVADSEQQIDDLYKFSNIKKDKVRVIPYIPPTYVYYYKDMNKQTADKILKKYQLPQNFIFYPGQFWSQKNHLRLIKALHLIRENYEVKISLVLVGNAGGHYQKYFKEVMDLVKSLNMTNQVLHLGYVSEKEMVALYKKARAFIAPPFQGPTTIPPLEAMVLGTPVATVNLFEVPKQVGDAGLLFNPFSIKDIADKVYRIWQDEKLRETLIQKGYEKTKDMTQENYAKKWEGVIEEALTIINYEKP